MLGKVDCAVCKDVFEKEETFLELPCGHIFHEPCIHPWLRDHNTCPVCRFELETESEETTATTA